MVKNSNNPEFKKPESFSYTNYADLSGKEMSAIMNMEHLVNTSSPKEDLYSYSDVQNTHVPIEEAPSSSKFDPEIRKSNDLKNFLKKESAEDKKAKIISSEEGGPDYYINGKPRYRKRKPGL